eukprot:956670-Rhodomonas_salina.1
MRPPKGVKDPKDRGRLLRVLRSLYGLKISAKNWHRTFVQKIKAFAGTAVDIEFVIVTSDECMFRFTKGNSVLIILIVVDDVLSATNDNEFRRAFLDFLRTEFVVTDDKCFNFFLGVGWDKKPDGYIIATQTAYIDRVIERFNLKDHKPSCTLMESNFSVDKSDLDENCDPKQLAWYQAAVGCTMYGMIWTKPEIVYHVNVLARYMTKPGPKLLKAAKKLLLYLKYTRLLGIRFSRDDPKGHGINTLSCYVDSSDGDDRITRRSTGGYA